MRDEITNWFKQLQRDICYTLEDTDKKGKFIEDKWQRDGGGGGITRVITNGNIIEKGGVNFSAVYGQLAEKISQALGLPASEFYATGVSIVLHPINPMVPIIHMNVRYFETMANDGTSSWWFGGGIDLTPHYVNKQDAKFFHQHLKESCDKHDADYYAEFKKWADDYFYLKHRDETRGIGGIFFDRLNEKRNKSKEELFDFVKEIGNTFCKVYVPIIKKNHTLPFGEKEIAWQKLRRGRYVEFNLVWDKGTKFGLDTDGRTESILMSLPPLAAWEYDYQTLPKSNEAFTLELLKKGIDWIN